MSEVFLDAFVKDARLAAAHEDAAFAIRTLLQESMQDKESMAEVIAAKTDDEVMLFEDDSCSIWTCRYSSDVVFSPHEHCMPVHIGVYRGTEVEVLYKREPGYLRHGGNKHVHAGDVISLGAEAIHAITADGDIQSHAIHIYQGALTKIERSLFDWETGEALAFTMENFYSLKRNKADMAEFNKT